MNELLLNEYKQVLSDPSFRLTAERLIIKCGVRVDLKGSDSLEDAVILYGAEQCTRFCEIYRIIGKVRDIKPKSVTRRISYAIMQAFDLPARLSEMVGTHIPPSSVHSGLVIAYLGKLFRNPELSLYA